MRTSSNDEVTKKIDLYAKQMEMVKLRINVVDAILNNEYTTPYMASNIELCSLQLRKCIELIVMASLVANSEEYLIAYNRLGRDWNASYISKDLKRINPRFYPTPIKIIQQDGKPDEFFKLDVTEFVACDTLMGYYEKIGALMHSDNPFATPPDYDAYKSLVKNCRDSIVKLLNCHLAQLSDGKSMLYVAMEVKDNLGVHVTYFEKLYDTINN